MAVHIVYCVRAGEAPARADPLAPTAVPIAREVPMEEMAKHIQPDGTVTMLFDGLRVPLPLPALAGAILRLIDGQRSVADIAGAMAASGGVSQKAFDAAWQTTFTQLERVNRLLLAPPA
jgi:hypothetical protein